LARCATASRYFENSADNNQPQQKTRLPIRVNWLVRLPCAAKLTAFACRTRCLAAWPKPSTRLLVLTGRMPMARKQPALASTGTAPDR